MKKVVVFFAAVALAIGAHGAAISWKLGNSVKAPNADGTISAVNAGAGTLSLYVWLVDEATYSAATADTILKEYSGKLDTADASIKNRSGSLGGTARTDGLAFSTTESTTYYGIVLSEYKSGDVAQYAANKATAIIGTTGTDATVTNLAKTWGGVTNGSAVVWSDGGPEPTSGLLLLLGAGLLALRRKQK